MRARTLRRVRLSPRVAMGMRPRGDACGLSGQAGWGQWPGSRNRAWRSVWVRSTPSRSPGRSGMVAQLQVRTVVVAAATGAMLAFVLDPSSGRRRRALLADKLGHYRRELSRRPRRYARGISGPVRGAWHALRRWLPRCQQAEPADALELTQRVKSTLGHVTDLSLADVTFEAVSGVIRLRGTMPDVAAAARLVEQLRAAKGVEAVESFLRLPGGASLLHVPGTLSAPPAPRAALKGQALRERLLTRWPGLTDAAILESAGHIDALVEAIHRQTGEPEPAISAALAELTLAGN
jgi:hyperosmotically inducible periplasmic protein